MEAMVVGGMSENHGARPDFFCRGYELAFYPAEGQTELVN